MSSRLNPSLLAELSVAIALAAVLSLFRVKLPHLIYGGSISLHTLPIVVVWLVKSIIDKRPFVGKVEDLRVEHRHVAVEHLTDCENI